MNRTNRSARATLTAWLILVTPLATTAAESAPPTETRSAADAPGPGTDQIDRIIQSEMTRQHIPGLSVAVARNGRPLLAQGYGLANVELNAPATEKTVYQLQSITKSFTATAIMMLVEEGRIALDAPVGRYLDETPESWKTITIRHLLTHTSGLKDFINEPTASLRLDVSEEEVFRAAVPRPLNFQPGEKYGYSNTNYHLLAMIIRKLTGQSYGDFLRDRVFEPLGMNQTRVISHTEIIPHRAAGYLWENNALRNGEYVAESILGYGGGGLRSTVPDMLRWDAALYSERLLKKASLEQMWAPTRLNDGQESGYGFGWGIQNINGHRCVSHTGGHATGFSTVIQRYVDDGLTVIVLTNIRANVGRIAQRIAALYVPAVVPLARKPIEDKEPHLTALIRTTLDEIAAGKVNPAHLTDDLIELIGPQLPALQLLARAAGPMNRFELLERDSQGGMRRFLYRATYARAAYLIRISLNDVDQLAEINVEEE